MKLYCVTLRDNRSADVAADDWIILDGKYLFTQNGKPRGDIFFKEEEVIGISVLDEDHNPNFHGVG